MADARTITGNVSIWLSKTSGPQDVAGDDQSVTDAIVVFGPDSDMSGYGYTRLSEGTLTFALPTVRDMVDSKAESLRAEITKTRADAEMKVNQLQAALQKLLAIEFDGSEA